MISTGRPKAFIAAMLFVLGALVGSIAPLLSLFGSNQYLLKLLLQTWQTYLFAYGWWPWSLAGGVVASLAYVLWELKSSRG
ncbi:MAG: hypothetical protein KKF33_07295 [Alphaproteobacteria bacterium]|nr:hypothetical protein [Alphaproteobacteria bacterium]